MKSIQENHTKLIITVILLLFVIGILPTAFGAFVIDDTLTFGGKVDVQGNAEVTTNASTNITYNSITLNGYLVNDGCLDTDIWFEYGKTIAYGNIREVSPFPTYIYAGGETTDKVYQYLQSDLTKNAETSDYGNTIRAITEDDDYIYVSGTSANIYKYRKSDMNKIAETGSCGIDIYGLTQDDEYIYAANFDTKVWQFWKSNMTEKTRTEVSGGPFNCIANDDTYVYAAGRWVTAPTVGKIYKYQKSDMSLVDTSADYGDEIKAITIDDDYVYIGGVNVFTINKYWKSNFTQKDTVASANIYALEEDMYYIYASGSNGEIWKYRKSDLVKVAESDDYGGTIYATTSDSKYIYAGGSSNTVWKCWKYNLTKKSETANYGGNIYATSSFDGYFITGDKFNYDLMDLLPGTTYHYRAVANNSNGTAYGSDKTFKTLSAISSNNSTSINTVTATLNGYLYYDVGENTECGFWVGNESTNKTTFQQNVTAGTKNSNEAFTKDVSSLTSGEYYYVRSWMNNSNGFWNSTNETYFLTLPNAPTGLTFVNSSYEQITLSWTNATVGVSNRTTVIAYKTTGYPTSPTDGTIGYNGTASSTTITGLGIDTTYYFSAWTYINASGSPFFAAFSGGFATASGSTAGGIYNITIRYEDNLTLVSNGVMAAFNHTCTARLRTGQLLNRTFPNINPFPMNCTSTPDVLFFDFKNLTLWRAITPEAGNRNLTFYVSNRPEYETGLNASECHLWYTFSFNDLTTFFVGSNQSKLFIYKFNGTEKYYVHQDYWSAEDTVDASLQYGDRYYLGVWSPTLYIPLLQYFDAHETTSPTIYITELYSGNDSIYNYVTINFSWGGKGNGLWVNYTDSSFGTNNFTINIYQTWKTNGTKILRNTTWFTLSQKDYHWTIAEGCNNSSFYYINVIINHSLFVGNQTYSALLYPYTSAITNPYWIDDWFDDILGDSPFVDVNPDSETYGQSLAWTHIAAFGACLILLMTIGHLNMPLTMIGVGSLLIVLETTLGVVVTRSFVGTTVGVLGGILLVVLGFIVALGGQKR